MTKEEIQDLAKQVQEAYINKCKKAYLTFDKIAYDYSPNSSCIVCTAPIKQVKLYDLQIGGMVVRICDECADRLHELISPEAREKM